MNRQRGSRPSFGTHRVGGVLQDFGPTQGAPAVRNGAGPQVAVTDPGGGRTALNPASSHATNQAAITAAGVNATIWFPAGTYFLSDSNGYFPQNGQTWYLQTPAKGTKKTSSNTAVLTRGQEITSWTAGTGGDTGLWFATGQTQEMGDGTPRSGVLADAMRQLFYTEREDYWKDKDDQGDGTGNTATHLWPVTAKADLFGGAGLPPVGKARYFDHVNDIVWIGFNPSGHTIHRTMNGTAEAGTDIVSCTGGKHDVRIRGGIFEMSPGSIATMSYGEGIEHDISFEEMTMRYANRIVLTAWGDFTAPEAVEHPYDMTVRNCYIGWGGQYAMASARLGDFTLENCEVAYGNFGPGAAHSIDDEGMMKFGGLTNFSIFKFNWIHHNNSSTWWDTAAGDLTFSENVVEDNPMGYGVMLEDVADHPGVVAHNLFKDNGYLHSWFVCSHGYSQYHNPSIAYDISAGHLRLNATDNLEITANWFQTLSTTNQIHHDIEIGWQSRSTGNGPQNTWMHHNRMERKLRWVEPPFAPYAGFITTDITGACHPYLATDNNKFDFNEYHVPSGLSGANDWFNRGGTSHLTFTQWKAGYAASCGGTGAPASYFDPNSTITADL